MPLYALVEFSNMTVANIEQRASPPPVPPGFRNIVDSDWAPGQTAMIGHIWDGAIPASFAAPSPIEIAEDVPEAVALVREAQAVLDQRMASLEAILGINQ
jgi:hypothetical protein